MLFQTSYDMSPSLPLILCKFKIVSIRAGSDLAPARDKPLPDAILGNKPQWHFNENVIASRRYISKCCLQNMVDQRYFALENGLVQHICIKLKNSVVLGFSNGLFVGKPLPKYILTYYRLDP